MHKTTHKHYYKIPTVYDDIDRIRNIDKCGKDSCKCSQFRQRKDWVIMDPALCESCDEYLYKCYGKYTNYDYDTGTLEPCIYHCTLMTEIFDLKLCNDCYTNNSFCSFCNDMLDK